MSSVLLGAVIGMLSAAALGIIAPPMHPLRWFIASWLLSGAIITAAWYLP